MAKNLKSFNRFIKNLDRKKEMDKKKSMNLRILKVIEGEGYNYVVNPKTKELHRTKRKNYCGSHNLMMANLAEFVPFRTIPENFFSSKCAYCFPEVITLGGKSL